MKQTKQISLELKNLELYHGTEQYHSLGKLYPNIKLTDGSIYVMENGYSWFITDVLAVIQCKLKDEEFLVIKLLVFDDNKAKMIITGGNEKPLYEQEYKYTNAKKNLVLYFTNNVLMLSGEY